MSRLLAIDLGERRIGLAIGDTSAGTSVPLATLRRETPLADAERINRVIQEQRVDELLVGLPLKMDGTEGQQALATRAWAADVSPVVSVPLRWRDERLTSAMAEQTLGRARRGHSGTAPSAAAIRRRRADVDRHAARELVERELRDRAGIARE